MNELMTYQDKTLTTYDEVERAAKAMAASGFFSDTKQASQAVVKILAARELGLGPFAGMNGVNIIQGKPSFSANIMAACVKKSGRYNYRASEITDKSCTIEFMEKLDGKWVVSGESKFTIEDAHKAGVKNLEKFPRNMLFARAMSNGVRWYCPDVMNGSVVYTPEELGADVDQDGNVINVPVVEITPVVELVPDGTVIMGTRSESGTAPDPDETTMTIEDACKVETSDNPPKRYGDLTIPELSARYNEMNKQLKAADIDQAERAIKEHKIKAAKMVIEAKKNGEI